MAIQKYEKRTVSPANVILFIALKSQRLQFVLIIISSLLCVFYGSHVIYENLFKV